MDAWVAMFAAMLGKPERAAEIKARSDSELAEVKALAAGRACRGPQHPVLQPLHRRAQGCRCQQLQRLLHQAGGRHQPATGKDPLPGSGMVGLDVEQVLRWDPEIILLGNFDAAMPQDLYSDPVWQNVSAVRAGRVYKVPLGGYRWDPPGQESPLMWHWLRDIAFPQQRSPCAARFPSTSGSCTTTSSPQSNWTRSSGPRPTAAQPIIGSSMLDEARPRGSEARRVRGQGGRRGRAAGRVDRRRGPAIFARRRAHCRAADCRWRSWRWRWAGTACRSGTWCRSSRPNSCPSRSRPAPPNRTWCCWSGCPGSCSPCWWAAAWQSAAPRCRPSSAIRWSARTSSACPRVRPSAVRWPCCSAWVRSSWSPAPSCSAWWPSAPCS